jgi:hypothetical protein
MASALKLLASDNTVGDGSLLIDRPPETSETARRIERLPTEVGVLLLTAGVINGMLPPPPGPFDLTIIISGGVVLWPRGFRAIEGWAGRHFPKAHRAGMWFLDRYLDDLERRYPDSTPQDVDRYIASGETIIEARRDHSRD